MSTHAPTWTLSPHEYHATVDKVAAINRRAQRRGFTGRLELHATQATEKVNVYPGDARERVVFVARLLGSPPAYAGWELLAAVDTLRTAVGGHEVVLRCAPGVSDVDVDRSLLQPGRCEHCDTVRTNRRHTYLVRRTSDSQLRQVGSTCLKDFLGWAGTPVFLSVDDTQDDLERGLGGGVDEFTPATVLAYAYAAVEVYGWAPASFEHPTKNIVAEALYGHGRQADEIRDELAPHLAAGEVAAPAIATALLEGLTENYGYEANLTSALRAASAGPRELGLLCSAIPAYQRVTGAKATAVQHAEAPSAWLGRVDAPLTATGVIATALTVDGYAYGTTQRLLVITTTEGTVKVVTAAGWAYDVSQGDEVTVAGTVKAHEVYREHKQTRLVRPRLVPSPALVEGGRGVTTLRHAHADGANVTFAGRTIQVQHLAAEASRHDHPDSATLLAMVLLELTARQEHGPHARLRGSVAAGHPSVPDTTVYHLVVETRSGERHLTITAQHGDLVAAEAALSAYLGI